MGSLQLSSFQSNAFLRGRWEGTRLSTRKNRRGRSSLNMVLTTPIDIIEQASTVNLLDDLIDESVRTSARRPIIRQFDPSSGWIWRRWKGTIFSETWVSCVRNVLYAIAIFLLYKSYPNIVDNHLTGFSTLWGQLLSVTTFTLTFFVNQSYALWKKCTQLSRRLQGRLHDIGMNMATHARRQKPETENEPSTYTPESRQILELMSRYVRMFNLLTYASFTRSHRPILTPRGMRRLVERGLLTPQERESLVEANIPPTQRHSAILMWMIRLFIEGRASGHILGGDGFEQHTLDKFHIIRAQYGAIGDELQGRMPLAYAHIVQVLVDLILWTYPLMAFSTGMSPYLVIAGTGLLTISYQGLFDLAKQFLDPYDNETYGKGEDPLCVDTLIAETNAGSVRWLFGFEEMPFNAEQLQRGELMDSLLPVRGYTVEDLAQMEEDRIKKEELRRREEEERLRQEAEAESEEEEPEVEESVLNDPEIQSQPAAENATALEDPTPIEVVSDVEAELRMGGEKVVHTVTTVGGNPFSLKKIDDDEYVGIVASGQSTANGNLEVANYLASLSPLEVEEQSTTELGPQDEVLEDMPEIVEEGDSFPVVAEELQSATSQKLSDDEYNEKLAAIEEAIKELNAKAQSDDRDEIQLLTDKKKVAASVEDEEMDEEPKRMTLEDYEEEVVRIITEAKEEMLETEAILSTKAGLDPLGWDYEDDELKSIADDDEADPKGDGEARDRSVMDDNLDVLEMDIDGDEPMEGENALYLEPPENIMVETHVDMETALTEKSEDDAHLTDIEKTRRLLMGSEYNKNGARAQDPEAVKSTDSVESDGDV
ncbi:unnamed protein product [Cylindrotheca closterium]|uniref:Bestrophin homolog n=1 Tax=Cylindrotheca closterium TaxID=2856 RepID=A0AAD2CXG4_9STRA|nr:unnamed protein product [Cylindrotheca closterium]